MFWPDLKLPPINLWVVGPYNNYERRGMNKELSEFEIKFYQRFADIFVFKYLEEGRLSAGIYAAELIKQENMSKAKPFVDEAFLRRGYDNVGGS